MQHVAITAVHQMLTESQTLFQHLNSVDWSACMDARVCQPSHEISAIVTRPCPLAVHIMGQQSTECHSRHLKLRAHGSELPDAEAAPWSDTLHLKVVDCTSGSACHASCRPAFWRPATAAITCSCQNDIICTTEAETAADDIPHATLRLGGKHGRRGPYTRNVCLRCHTQCAACA